MIRATALFAILFARLAAQPLYWQPVIDYTMSFPGDRPDAAPIINPFENFTHTASDFGWMGPGENRIDVKGGVIHVKSGSGWAGAWHSLAGLAARPDRTLDAADLTGLGGDPAKRCAVRAVSVNASGTGKLVLELATATRQVVWRASVPLIGGQVTSQSVPVDGSRLGPVKFLHWIVEPGTELRLSSIGFMVERPEMSLEEWAFRISLGKLRRCHDPASGLTRDRGHTPEGSFDTIAATGMHALASAAAAEEGVLDRRLVLGELATTVAAMEALPKAYGVLPHFLHRSDDGRITLVAGTEFSTVDSAIALHGLLLASRILEDWDMHRRVVAMIHAIDFDTLTDADGWISHGVFDDGKTLLGPVWRDWGGETALVLALEAMASGRSPRGGMCRSGEPYRGVGFIAEIQSLFYPDFDRPEPDLVSGIIWPSVRRKLLQEQLAYVGRQWPDSAAARHGLFGVSAGEAGMPGAGYAANGVEVIGVRWLHPHYMMMGPALNDPRVHASTLRALDANQLLYPFGLPENIEVDMHLHNPMQGGLNAAFEALATYHGWRQRRTPANRIDAAALADPWMRQAASRFFPAGDGK